MKSIPKRRGKSKRKGRLAAPYNYEFKCKVVRLYLEEGYRAEMLAKELSLSAVFLFLEWVTQIVVS